MKRIQRYNVQAPRYTSYPTVPLWENSPSEVQWKNMIAAVNHSEHSTEGISLYIHLPFCEKLCTYCGCNKRITVNHDVETGYLDSILKEWGLYLKQFKNKPLLREIHLGGGTPTFFDPQRLAQGIESILESCELHPQFEASFEGHPNNTRREHLHYLHELGFNRVSFGIQDFDPKVQKAINRFQSIDQVHKVTQWARELNYHGIHFDLVYGLPFQTICTALDTLNKTISVRPDRISYYGYAHVPWKYPGQRGYDENDLPKGQSKLDLYNLGKELFEKQGYHSIGMDHFALETDTLYQSSRSGEMYRNFMGYTAGRPSALIGLGASAISELADGFSQNEKSVEKYQYRVGMGEFPISNGHLLSREDKVIKQHIINLMCHYKTDWSSLRSRPESLPEILQDLNPLKSDHLVVDTESGIRITDEGKPFVRNVCMAFDERLRNRNDSESMFSKSI